MIGRSKILTAAVVFLLPTLANAHPGHGSVPDETGFLHYLAEPSHSLVMICAVGSVVAIALWRRTRRVE